MWNLTACWRIRQWFRARMRCLSALYLDLYQKSPGAPMTSPLSTEINMTSRSLKMNKSTSYPWRTVKLRIRESTRLLLDSSQATGPWLWMVRLFFVCITVYLHFSDTLYCMLYIIYSGIVSVNLILFTSSDTVKILMPVGKVMMRTNKPDV